MVRWKIWESQSRAAQPVWLELIVKELSGLQGVHGNHAQVTVHWLGSHRNSLERVSTARKFVQPDGRVIWWEGFRRQCNLHVEDSQTFKPWIAELEIRIFGSLLARTRIDISKFPSDGVERSVGISIKFSVRGYDVEASLTVSLRLYPSQPIENLFPALSRGLSLHASSSSSSSGSDSKPSLWRALSVSGASKIRDMVFSDVNEDRRLQSPAVHSISGPWVEKTVTSRDGRMELQTEIFFSSIDQRSQTVAGEGACSVIAAVIADWLHRNPKDLPLGRQFEELIRVGASEWRLLCADAKHHKNFPDFHFDLDTVVNARLRPIKLVTGKSFVGFFSKPGGGGDLMSFDQIWEEIVSSEAEMERVYVVGWNDHFFVLKLEKETIYVIDSLGKRLSDECSQAYILKFNVSSRVYLKEGERRELVSFGFRSCKEFLKGFLAGLPLREIDRAPIWEDRRHDLMQVEFHYTSPM